MYNKVISVTTSISAKELPSEGPGEQVFPMVEKALAEGYTVKEVVSHQNGAIVNHLFVLGKGDDYGDSPISPVG